MLKGFLAVALCGSALLAGSAQAAVTFNVDGRFTNVVGGTVSLGTLTGTFTTNDALSAVTGYSLTASASGAFAGFAYTPATAPVSVSVLPMQFFQLDSPGFVNELRLYFSSPLTSRGATLDSRFSYENEPSGGNRFLSGTVTAVTSAVPEPASWAMTMLGIGIVGYAMRRRQQVTTRVRFA